MFPQQTPKRPLVLRRQFNLSSRSASLVRDITAMVLALLLVIALVLELIVELPREKVIASNYIEQEPLSSSVIASNYENSLALNLSITDISEINSRTVMSGEIMVSSLPSYMVDQQGHLLYDLRIFSSSFIDPKNVIVKGNRTSSFPFSTVLEDIPSTPVKDGFISNVYAESVFSSGAARKIPVAETISYIGPSGLNLDAVPVEGGGGYQISYYFKVSYMVLSAVVALFLALTLVYTVAAVLSLEIANHGSALYARCAPLLSPLLVFTIHNAEPEGNQLLYQFLSWHQAYGLTATAAVAVLGWMLWKSVKPYAQQRLAGLGKAS